MNIGIDIRCLAERQRTGVGEYAFELLSALFTLDQTHTYTLFSNAAKNVSDNSDRWIGPQVTSARRRWPNKLLHGSILVSGWPRLDTFADSRRPIDIFFSPNLNFISLSARCKFILTVHDLSFEVNPTWFSAKQKLWHKAIGPRQHCERADVIVVPSENTKRDIIDMYDIDEKKITVVYPGLTSGMHIGEGTVQEANNARVRARYSLPHKYLFFLGTIEPRKNVDGIIQAFAQSRLAVDGYGLVIAGALGVDHVKVMNLIRQTQGVQYIGYVDAEDKSTLYHLAELFVYPSFYEGFGFPVIEAMACGTPVVTSNRSALPEITRGAAYLVNPYDTGEIADALRYLVAQRDRRAKMSTQGLECAHTYSWYTAARSLVSLFNTFSLS